MRVLMFGWELPPHNSGGLGVACYNLAKALCMKHNEVLFVLPQKVAAPRDFPVIFANVSIDVLPVSSLLAPYLDSAGYAEVLRESGQQWLYGRNLYEEVLRYGREARRIAERETFDIIHAHDWLSFPAGVAAKRASGKSLVVHIHATEFDRTGGSCVDQRVYDIERWGMEQADAVIAVSQFTKNIIVERYGIPSEKITVVHNAVEEGSACARASQLVFPGKRIVLFVGRMTLQKGPDYFVLAARKVLETDTNVMFVMAGDGDMYHQVVEKAAELGISDHFVFAGFLRGDALVGLYRSADLFVMPSVSEPFGLTALEALQNNAPVLISKQAGVGEVLSHCLKVDFWDVEEMASKILAVVRYKELRQCLAEQGRAEAGRFSWAASADRCIALYHSLHT